MTGTVRAWPLLAPLVVSSSIGPPSNGPPTLPLLARNSSMIDRLKSFMSAMAGPPGVGVRVGAGASGRVTVVARLLRGRGGLHAREEPVVRVQDHQLPGAGSHHPVDDEPGARFDTGDPAPSEEHDGDATGAIHDGALERGLAGPGLHPQGVDPSGDPDPLPLGDTGDRDGALDLEVRCARGRFGLAVGAPA